MGQILQQVLSALSNENLSVMHNVILWINWICVILAGYFNYKAANSGLTKMRRTHFIIAGLALAYIIGYPLLIFTGIDPILWTEWFRGIAIFTWIFVWIGPAWISMHIWKEIQKLLKESHDK